ncbi:hypothetical protein A2334_05970 [Candidatus Roizmanbacteria bacterium RIFOXYB2_FULL_38_10]|uniref:Methyltransferase type 11 domain-containing protein n=1 Tax=Candidatus Roizmanbacteria bacterium RIFOXYD1_FULL_38_12 TaxID=1802093 RepID=A0A1F7L0T6_9BACT|nr:MAG: hypothetical protein A3K47_03090 [Candidatus Roizmanbacteria bacterium RIFOXYA2_FULL_38_14]OGK63752.1 MAG: hypothetical protein A3K27_03090 [Candidatus Roizmanbacteria bacterium RIFOXYA1_FULL_37_12]OGK65598.1 MAG: hypothetical protein A3K38_03090 [Candidatus Roizmanbacteria bacterium RIFOXYB1_FULL_40_23]OGK68381.1 MAG: hypothetical protein A2334_05970 [Candidatus Roizmanbacteria bacterium RIFOXYB2_FULL_38_10]OGK70003.1 MAG: hypothetical protein A3K21_03095 [Candidatus Roizmanbacteria ba
MATKEFNIIDKFISWMRLGKVLPFVKHGDTVLDFGCGYQAYLLKHIKNRIKKGIGLDRDSESKNIAPNCEIRKYHFTDRLPFTDKIFDTIFLLAVLEHVEPPHASKLMRESKRILKAQGKVVLTTPTKWGKVILEFLAFKLGIISKEEVMDHKKYYGKKDLEILAKNTGFVVTQYKTFQLGGNSLCVLIKK